MQGSFFTIYEMIMIQDVFSCGTVLLYSLSRMFGSISSTPISCLLTSLNYVYAFPFSGHGQPLQSTYCKCLIIKIVKELLHLIIWLFHIYTECEMGIKKMTS